MSTLSLGNPLQVEMYEVYSYHHLDDLSFFRKPKDVFNDNPQGSLPIYIEAIKTRLRNAGWEGDGELGIIWLPPFVDVGIEDTHGTYVWCVKQSNNGTAWIASGTALNFNRLR